MKNLFLLDYIDVELFNNGNIVDKSNLINIIKNNNFCHFGGGFSCEIILFLLLNNNKNIINFNEITINDKYFENSKFSLNIKINNNNSSYLFIDNIKKNNYNHTIIKRNNINNNSFMSIFKIFINDYYNIYNFKYYVDNNDIIYYK